MLKPPRGHKVSGSGRLIDGRGVWPHQVERRFLLQRDRHLEACLRALTATAALMRGTARGRVVIVHHLQRRRESGSSLNFDEASKFPNKI